MPTLNDTQLDQVNQQIMERYSDQLTVIPVNKSQLKSFLALVDSELESAEVSIVQAIPAGPGRDWLINNASIGRDMIQLVEDKRKEVL